MTKKELKQVYYLSREIQMWQSELNRINYRSVIGSPQFSGMPHNGGISDKVASTAINTADIQAIINNLICEVQEQCQNILKYIETVDDSFIRQILYYRYVCCMSWVQVAMGIGGGNTHDGVRKAHDRYFVKQ